jgi:outer membrane protein assembly factor BamD
VRAFKKIEKKVYENAKYNTISDFKSAVLDNFIIDFPGTKYKEDAFFLNLIRPTNSNKNSVPTKMEERLNVSKVSITIFNKAQSRYEI